MADGVLQGGGLLSHFSRARRVQAQLSCPTCALVNPVGWSACEGCGSVKPAYEGAVVGWLRRRRQAVAEEAPAVTDESVSADIPTEEDPAHRQACELLLESVEKAENRLLDRCVPAGGSSGSRGVPTADKAGDLQQLTLVARQLLANEDVLTSDLLNFLAEVEAATQLLIAPTDEDALRYDVAQLRSLIGGCDESTSQSAAGSRLMREALVSRERLEETFARIDCPVVSPQLQAELASVYEAWEAQPALRLGAFAKKLETQMDELEGHDGLLLQEWADEAPEEAEAARLQALCEELQGLAAAQQQLSALTSEAGEILIQTTVNSTHARESSGNAARSLSHAAKDRTRLWPVKASIGTAVVGAIAGACVAGPVGAAIGCGASAALGAAGGGAAKRLNDKSVDQVLSSVQ